MIYQHNLIHTAGSETIFIQIYMDAPLGVLQGCQKNRKESLVRSEVDIYFLFLMAVLGTTADPWLARSVLFVQVQKLRCLT